MKKQPVNVVWFKRDLRISDHHPLAEAAARGHVLPLFVVEPEWWACDDMSARQFAFMRESAVELAETLDALGAPLLVRTGSVIGALEEIAGTAPIAGLWSHAETGGQWTYRRDIAVGAWCRDRGIPWHEVRQDGVIRRLRARNGWATRWDRRMREPLTPAPKALPPPLQQPALQAMPNAADIGLAPDAACNGRQTGGRAAGEATLNSFLIERGEPYRRAMSSPLTADQACSRISPHLAWGTLSMREAAQATWRKQRALKAGQGPAGGEWRGSLASFSGRLHWHCHFMQKLEDEPRIEFDNLHRAYDALRRPQDSDPARLAAWCSGATGLPFVDACMRYLNATGWLNFRMRAMLMAVASYHLWLDWRAPGLHLSRQFTDYEPGIHWPQVQMQSGTTGINTVRIYNPVKQGYDQDPDGSFVRRWVPELASLPGALVHEPWRHPDGGSIVGRSYPEPIVCHTEAARAARQKIHAIRATDSFRSTAARIQTRHGSRKSGLAMRGRKRSKSGQPSDANQLTLDFGPHGTGRR